jgi:5,10-methylenetetrahydromethanopterin reductase
MVTVNHSFCGRAWIDVAPTSWLICQRRRKLKSPTIGSMTALGICFHRTFPAPFVVEVAETCEALGLDDLWIIEDCFFTAGISLAATALARTERLTVGLGILPAVARNPAITAMEIATLAALAPGRVIAGIGHGVQDWMAQMGARPTSPLATLEEVITTVKQLLTGEQVSFDGKHVHLQDVQLVAPPAVVPPVLAGVGGPKSLAMAGQVADGLVLAEGTGPMAVRAARLTAGHSAANTTFSVSVFTPMSIYEDRQLARRLISPFISTLITGKNYGVKALPFFNEMQKLFETKGTDGLVGMPSDWWIELGAIGTVEDAAAHVHALSEAGTDRVALFPAPVETVARHDLKTAAQLKAILS